MAPPSNTIAFKASHRRQKVIDWLKQQGDPLDKALWPDGRKFEEVIL